MSLPKFTSTLLILQFGFLKIVIIEIAVTQTQDLVTTKNYKTTHSLLALINMSLGANTNSPKI